MKKLLFVATVMLQMIAATAFAANSDDILGIWNNGEKDAKIEIARCGDKYCGTIIWLKIPDYPADSKEGVPGTPKRDHRNPDEARKSVPVLGLQIAHGFTYAGENIWKEGKIYDPKSGKTYSGKMTLEVPDQLSVRGFIGISLIGRTTTWTRVK